MKDQGSGKIKRYEFKGKGKGKGPPPPGTDPSENEMIPDSMLPDFRKKPPRKKK